MAAREVLETLPAAAPPDEGRACGFVLMVRSRAQRGVSNHGRRVRSFETRPSAAPQDEGRACGFDLMVRSRAQRGVSNHGRRVRSFETRPAAALQEEEVDGRLLRTRLIGSDRDDSVF
jgi:hypothetical protein